MIYNAAIIGCGRIASGFDKALPKDKAFSHAGAYLLNSKTKLIAASDIDQSKLTAFKNKWNVASVYTDYQAMLEKEKIDILSVATAPQSHWPIIKDAVKFPLKAIYCEKPIADSVENAQKIITACKKARILLIVNHQRRFGPFYQELKKKLSDDTLGKVQQVNCYYTRGIANTCTHMIDLFIFLFGEPESVSASSSINKSPFKNDPNLDANIRFKNGLCLSLKACDDNNYLILEVDILASCGRIRFGEQLEYFKAKVGKNLLRLNELARMNKPQFKSEYPRYGNVSLTYAVKHIVNCLEKNEQPLSRGEDAIKTLKLIKAILVSAHRGGTWYDRF